MIKRWRIAVKHIVVIMCSLGFVASSSSDFQEAVSDKALSACHSSQTPNNEKRECNATFLEGFLDVINVTNPSDKQMDEVYDRTQTCTQTLNYLTAHHASFAGQGYSVVSNLSAHLQRLIPVWPESFEDCLSLRISEMETKMRGQYCIAYFLGPSLDKMTENERNVLEGRKEGSRYPIPPLETALCIPDSCSAVDVQDYLKFLLKESASKYTIFVPEYFCQTDKPEPVPLFTKFVIVALMVILFLAIVGTLLEVSNFLRKARRNTTKREKTSDSNKAVTEHKESFPRSIANCFSLFSNSWYLFKMDTANAGEMEAFNGIKFLMSIGCQVIHVVYIGNHNGWSNAGEADFLYNITVRGFFYIQLLLQVAVGMSGTGITQSTLHRIQNKKEEFKLIPFYLRRLWRLTMPYYTLLALVIGIVPYIGSGPKWQDVVRSADSCKNYWWTNVFYLNNYFNDPICQFQTWYLAADVQLLLIAPLFILGFNRSARAGLTLVSIFVSLSIGKIFYHAYYDSLNAYDISVNPVLATTVRYFRELYFLPYSRIGCYCMGITFGYVVHTYGKAIPLKSAIHHWLRIAATTMIFSPFWLWYRYSSPYLPAASHFEAALCEALSRILFTSGAMYMATSIHAGLQDGITKSYRSVFCNKFFVFTGKLHYSVFLLHIIVIEVFLGSLPQPMEYSTLQFLKVVFGLLALTYLIAIPFTLLAVLPFARMERILEEKFMSIVKGKVTKLDKHN